MSRQCREHTGEGAPSAQPQGRLCHTSIPGKFFLLIYFQFRRTIRVSKVRNRPAQAGSWKVFENKALSNWHFGNWPNRANLKICKSFRYWDLGGIAVKLTGLKSRGGLFLLGFLQVESLKPAKHWDLIGIHPSDPQ